MSKLLVLEAVWWLLLVVVVVGAQWQNLGTERCDARINRMPGLL